MYNISSQLADLVFMLSNILLVVGAVLALIGTAGTFWSSGIRDKYSNERIAANEAETARAKSDAAKANADAAIANSVALNAKVEIEKAKTEQERLKLQMSWRTLSAEQSVIIGKTLREGGVLQVWLTFVKEDPESNIFREDINQSITSAGIKTKYYCGYTMAVGLKVKGGSVENRQLVLRAFSEACVLIMESSEPGFNNGELEILVGSKPPINLTIK